MLLAPVRFDFGYNRTAKVVIIFHLSKHSPIILLKLYRNSDPVGPVRLGPTCLTCLTGRTEESYNNCVF